MIHTKTIGDERLSDLACTILTSPFFTGANDLDRLADKQLLFLVVAGLKPVADLISYHQEKQGDVTVSVADDEVAVTEFLNSLGVAYSFMPEQDGTALSVAVAQSQAEADAVWQTTGDSDYGELMGFPNTAIEAYMQGTLLSHDEAEQLALSTYHDPAFAQFSVFRLSKAHALEELKMLKQWYDVLKQYGLVDEK